MATYPDDATANVFEFASVGESIIIYNLELLGSNWLIKLDKEYLTNRFFSGKALRAFLILYPGYVL